VGNLPLGKTFDTLVWNSLSIVSRVVSPFVVTFSVAAIASAAAQTPSVPPGKNLVLHEQRQVDRFAVQKWASEASPDLSAAGSCECVTMVYEGHRQILNLGLDYGITRVESSGTDITGDGRAELVVTRHSGGAHCCESTTIYSVDGGASEILAVSTGNCPEELVDRDGRRAAVRSEQRCGHCRQRLRAQRSDRQWCSDRCRKAAHRRTRAAEKTGALRRTIGLEGS
jgi:hypothetical protein